MTVPAASTVRVVNQTGHRAKLRLGGAAKGMVPDNGSTDVVFRRGTTALTLTPTCALRNDATPVLVTAQPSAPAATPEPIPHPSVDDLSTLGGDQDGSSNPSDFPGNDTPSRPVHSHRAASAAGHSVRTRAHSPHLVTTPQAAKAATKGQPAGGQRAKVKSRVKSGSGTARGAKPAFSGLPLGGTKELVPGVREPDLDPPATEPGPAAVSASTSEIAAAEPVAAMEPMGKQEPIGLLGAIAAVCALGVGIAAIRAFVSQRANRA
jgi:hypothetical protein